MTSNSLRMARPATLTRSRCTITTVTSGKPVPDDMDISVEEDPRR